MKTIFRILASIVGLLLLASAYSGWVNPNLWSAPALLGLALPLIMVAAVLVALMLLLLKQWRALILLTLCAIVAWPVMRLYVPLRGEVSPPEGTTTFRVMTYNVAGFDIEARTMRYILNQDADFVLLQEASMEPVDFTDLPQHVELREEIDQKYPFRSQGYHDLVILSKLPYTVQSDTTLKQGGALADSMAGYHFYAKIFNVQLAGQPLAIVNVHLQSIGLTGRDKELYKKLTRNQIDSRGELRQVKSSLLDKLQGAYKRRASEATQLRSVIDHAVATPNVIVCGDFNDTPGSYSYRTIMGDDFADAYAQRGRWPVITFNRDRFYFKIDHILYRGNMTPLAMRCDRAGGSDHYPLVATFAITGNPPEKVLP